MVTNRQIATYFNQLASIMELHKGNPFKIRFYKNTYLQLRKLDRPLTGMEREEIAALKGVGKATTEKILEIVATNRLETLEAWKAKTPPGVVEMLGIKGFGPGKIRVVWQELGCETVGELLYACNENRLVGLKGFGQKTQRDWIDKINFHLRSRDKYLYARIEGKALAVLEQIRKALPDAQAEFTGAFRRQSPILDAVDILVGTSDPSPAFGKDLILERTEKPSLLFAKTAEGLPVRMHTCTPSEWGSKQFKLTATRTFAEAFLAQAQAEDFTNLPDEKAIFGKAALPYLIPALREDGRFLGQPAPDLVEVSDIKGVIHAHSTYSDGINPLSELAEYCRAQGFAYLAISDHSQSAFYANGLKPERVLEQWSEIDALNANYSNFKIYKGIESDILNDGRLDYEDDLLAGFDFVIASVHSNLRMNEPQATGRIIKAVEHPATTILGHPSGRLLLSRKGYPLDYEKIIDACAANGVAIELNANPLRLDLDYGWIPYCMEKGVKISINPDAHSTAGVHDIRYGVLAARKGGLVKGEVFSIDNGPLTTALP